MKPVCFALAVSLAGLGCAPARSDTTPPGLRTAVEHYIEVYAARRDMHAFVSLFRPEGVLKDIMLGQRFEGRQAIADFYDWDAPGFSLVDPTGPVIDVASVAYAGDVATLRGAFSAFSWQGTAYPRTPFVIRLQFDAAGQIVLQEDWIAYPTALCRK